MIKHSAEAIEAKVREIWKRDFFCDNEMKIKAIEPPVIKVSFRGDDVLIKISMMYEYPSLSFQHLMALAAFFGTKNINDDERFSYGGCETCDYGSKYEFTLTVRPE